MAIPRLYLLVEPLRQIPAPLRHPAAGSHFCCIVTFLPVHIPHPGTAPFRRFALFLEIARPGVGHPSPLLRSGRRRRRSRGELSLER